MKTKLIACCLLSYLLGAASLFAWNAATADPMKNPYYLAVSYDLDTGTHVLDGVDVGRDMTVASHYLHDWVHIFNRDKGIEILERLANQGYAGAMAKLSFYYTIWAMDWENWEQNLKARLSKKDDSFDKSLYWARRAAERGSLFPLAGFIAADYLTNIREPAPEDIALFASYGNAVSGVAYFLAEYYGTEVNGEKRDAEKHAYWLNHFHTHKFTTPPADRPRPILTQWALYKR